MREKPRRRWHERGVRGSRAGIARCSRVRCSSQKRSVARWSRRGDRGGTHQAAIVHFFKETTAYGTGSITDGFRLLPRLVKPLLVVPNHAVWLLPSPEFRQAVFESRGRRNGDSSRKQVIQNGHSAICLSAMPCPLGFSVKSCKAWS